MSTSTFKAHQNKNLLNVAIALCNFNRSTDKRETKMTFLLTVLNFFIYLIYATTPKLSSEVIFFKYRKPKMLAKHYQFTVCVINTIHLRSRTLSITILLTTESMTRMCLSSLSNSCHSFRFYFAVEAFIHSFIHSLDTINSCEWTSLENAV